METGYFPPFHILKDGLEISEDGLSVTMSQDLFRLFVKAAAVSVGFDPIWYRTENPDVGAAVAAGDLASELDHFAVAGYQEGRLPAYFPVDEEWYYERNPDVSEAVASGEIADGDTHFNEIGYHEGRAPDEDKLLWVEQWQEAIAASADRLHERRQQSE
ncbi:hypothetical protein [Oryzibacter oryziterrae]|uniref:hypothetical protein n=1 Tax=Oryzibacter oryziterrae TaxID=2766474 RepID=UPI001F397423|nr:hypothetical protein [Oryzibacter oryziterrae]